MNEKQKFALKILEFSHDKNIRSDLDIIMDLLVEIKHTGKLRSGGEQYPNSESCYEAIEALKALKTFIKTEGEIDISTKSYNGLEEGKD